MSDNDSERSSVANAHDIGGYHAERLGQTQQVVIDIDDDDDEPMMDIDDDEEEEESTSFLQIAVNYYQMEIYKSAVGSFELWRKTLATSDGLETLSAAADLALCRFRASTHIHFQNEILYREAILANDKYVHKIRTLGRKDLLEAAILASITSIWVHTKMNNLRLARHNVWDVLHWAVTVASPGVAKTCTLDEALMVLSFTLTSRSVALRKFRHVLTVLDLIEEKNVSKVLERSIAQKGNTAETRLCDQEEAATMLARHKLGMASATATASTNGVAYKMSVLLQAVNELREPTTERSAIYEKLRSVSGSCNPSDINLMGCFEAEVDCQLSLETFGDGLKYLRDDDLDLWRGTLSRDGGIGDE
jgi:hypothetical protein